MRKYTPRNRKQWRDWLARNHADAEEVWLVFYKKHTGKPTVSYNDAVEEALCFGWIDGIRKRVDDERYMHRFTPRQPKSNWSASNRERVARLSEQGLITEAGYAVIEAARGSGAWDDAGSRAEIEMPPELADALQHSEKARAFFDSLAPSYRRQYVEWIGTAKRSETRAKRLQETMSLLRAGKKLGMR